MDLQHVYQLYPGNDIKYNMSGLYADSIMKAFDTKQVLTDVFITCKAGEIIGLLGRNGSGKSTLMKIIFGSLKADQKYVKADNKMIFQLYDRRGLISYLPQDNFLPDHVRVKTMISMFCDKDISVKLFSKPYMKNMLQRKGRQLSGGEKRLIEIFLTIYSDAKYILMDEPFNGVAPIYIDDIKNTIMEESKSKGFILTDHDYKNILDVSTRIILLRDGGTREINKAGEIKKWGYIPENQ